MNFKLIVIGGASAASPEGQAPESSKDVWRVILGTATIGLLIASLWVVIGSMIYPLWWYEALWCGGIFDPLLIRAGFGYLLDDQVWFLVAFPVLMLALGLVIRRSWTAMSRLLNRYGAVTIFICTVGLLINAVVIRHTQRTNYAIWTALQNVSVALVDLSATLASLGVSPTQIQTPVEFHFLDRTRVAALYSQIEPLLAEREQAVSSQDQKGVSTGLSRTPIGLSIETTTSRSETRSYKSIELSADRKCLAVINNLLRRPESPYFTKAQIMLPQSHLKPILEAILPFQQQLKANRSLFVRTDPSIVNKLFVVTKGTTKENILDKNNSFAEAELRKLSGLVIVDGVFRKTALHDQTATFEEQFAEGPRPVWFQSAE